MANQTAVASQLSVRGLHKDQFTYTKCYCEENVYMAIKKLHGVLPGSGCAVFISNTSQQVQPTQATSDYMKCAHTSCSMFVNQKFVRRSLSGVRAQLRSLKAQLFGTIM